MSVAATWRRVSRIGPQRVRVAFVIRASRGSWEVRDLDTDRVLARYHRADLCRFALKNLGFRPYTESTATAAPATRTAIQGRP